jgi:hypothetical protein
MTVVVAQNGRPVEIPPALRAALASEPTGHEDAERE